MAEHSPIMGAKIYAPSNPTRRGVVAALLAAPVLPIAAVKAAEISDVGALNGQYWTALAEHDRLFMQTSDAQGAYYTERPNEPAAPANGKSDVDALAEHYRLCARWLIEDRDCYRRHRVAELEAATLEAVIRSDEIRDRLMATPSASLRDVEIKLRIVIRDDDDGLISDLEMIAADVARLNG